LNNKEEQQKKLIFHYGKYCMKVWLICQARYEREEEEMTDGNKTLNKKQNRSIFDYGKYSMREKFVVRSGTLWKGRRTDEW